ncbi:MAG TPA: hypothetical protein PLT37_00190 [Kiritimatiellia bacterium]|nr:hypothetical protein [Kiritimatiellia bacterium]
MCDITKIQIDNTGHPDRKDDTMTTNEQTTMGHLLGTVDALHEPLTLTGEALQADWQNRDDYREGGGAMPWSNPGGDAAERKAYQRARDGLVGAGLVLVTAGGKRAGLTAEGLAEARRLCGLPTLADALCGLDFMADAPEAARWMPGGYLSEATLAGLPPTYGQGLGKPRLPDSAGGVHDALLPLLVAGLVEWRTCHYSGVYLYRLTAEGRGMAERRRGAGEARAADWPRLVARCQKIKTLCPAATDAYIAAWESVGQARQTATPPRPNVHQHEDPVDAPKAATA